MKFEEKTPPRKFTVGQNDQLTIKDCGTIKLNPDEQITFITKDGKEYDVGRKDWGFYATPSINDRLKRFGFKTALVKNIKNQFYIMLVEKDKIIEFKSYCDSSRQTVETWLDER